MRLQLLPPPTGAPAYAPAPDAQASTEVGCGIAACGQNAIGPEYLITCRYSPPGNSGGPAEFTKNLPV